MKSPKKTYIGAAVFFDRLDDDGWPEADSCPIDGCTLPDKCSHECVQGVGRLSLFWFLNPYCGSVLET
jgi:hypothetical protein